MKIVTEKATLDDALSLLGTAKAVLACQCFRLMLEEGLSWDDIFFPIVSRIRPEVEGNGAIAQLENIAEVLKLEAKDFSVLEFQRDRHLIEEEIQ